MNWVSFLPWADCISTRLDPSNGLCLFVLYDSLFEHGYFSLSDDLTVMVTPKVNILSYELQEALEKIDGRKISRAKNYQIKIEYVQYHRNKKFIR